MSTYYWHKTKLLAGLLGVGLAAPALAQRAPAGPDSITVAIEPEYTQVSAMHRFLLGNSYRREWAAPVRMRVFHLTQEKGGLTIVQRGGGLQTKSLRLKDPTGQQWVLRTLQKYPERGLPPTLRPTIAKDILQDQVSASHPYSSVVVPPLAAALGIPHANPEVVYVPDDPALGEYRKDFANQVFLFEEREPLDADKTDNTEKTQARLQKDNDNYVDQATVLRARLLDILLGDYDRHEDQWRWQRVEDGKGTRYEPVPRDRDHVFYKPTGLFPKTLSLHLLMANVQGYNDHIRSINRWNAKAKTFDRYFLNALSEDDWKTQIAYVQRHLTDSLITQAVRRLPPNIYQISGPRLVRDIIARRNILEAQALHYYRSLARMVEVSTSDKRERVAATRLPGGLMQVTVNKLKKNDSLGNVLYQRTFDPADTREVRLYGLGGDDQFAVSGAARTPIRLRLIGGEGKDVFAVAPEVPQRGRLRIYDRADEPNQLPAAGQARLITATDTVVNSFNKASFQYDYVQPLLSVGYNRDYGVQLIGNFVYQKQGFRKAPYGSRQSLLVNYGLANQSLLLSYSGIFKRKVGENDLLVNVTSLGPNYTSHFFGVGNESRFDRDPDDAIRYYRNDYNLVTADVRLSRTYQRWQLSGGLLGQYYNSGRDKNTNRLLTAYADQNPTQDVFRAQTYAGVAAGTTFDTRDRALVARRGVLWTTSLTALHRLDADRHTFAQALTEFSFHFAPGRDSSRLVVANRTGGGATLGDAAYFQQFKLGGTNNLRGFYYWRFTGKHIAYNNLEVRFKLADFTSYLAPGTLGLVLFNDIGRVWTPGEASQRWHAGYGGGVYFLPAQLALLQAVVGFSKEGAYPYISAGVRF
ncbi:MAG TPA: BamA/TamA family outer membrane protein [Hymenobacter sp.]|uniref:BamA/TamA family outer membrane protein n=1 Tax=Hymenobacter sp. TaxID=1898978 RepID=UPI002D809950|nr:BamA/TamA family outer membrane protein [Hymenobacter sp.]HET9501945.1 BamA/TamA family outer membrane protein [Hymenobacter sp.]